jgi:hypothetical protein
MQMKMPPSDFVSLASRTDVDTISQLLMRLQSSSPEMELRLLTAETLFSIDGITVYSVSVMPTQHIRAFAMCFFSLTVNMDGTMRCRSRTLETVPPNEFLKRATVLTTA